MNVEFREAIEEDVPTLVRMLADDILGAKREEASMPLHAAYRRAFRSIREDPNNELTVVESSGAVAGMLQLTFIPYLTHKGSWRCLIEGVRIAGPYRGKGLGTVLIRWAIERAKERHCRMVQLTSDKQRPDAVRFYESLGFKPTHEGMKLQI